jgi:phthalate 4,5-cis-dihydrodiol dehydrogenase
MALLTTDGKPVLRLGVIGLGGATKQIMPSLMSHPHVRITAGADLRPEARARFAADLGAATYDSVEALCDSPDVDAVYIATPHQWHAQHAVAAAERGKHIIVEKPMALTLATCDAMIEAADRNGVYIVVGHTHSYDAPIMKMREIIRSGELGPMSMINTWNYTNFLYRPRRPEELRTDQGGGIIYNQLPHQVDMVRLLGGGQVRSVRSRAWVLDPSRPTEGSHITFLEFEDGSAASMVFSGYDYFDTDEFHFWVDELGTEKRNHRHASARAALRKIGGADAESALKLSSSYGRATAGTAPPGAPAGAGHQPHFGVTIASCALGDLRPSADGVLVYTEHGCTEIALPLGRAFPDKCGVIDELYDAVANGRQPLRNGAWGKATMEVCEAILTSARERKEIYLSHQTALNDSVLN